eukprot:TRINITY_DN27573_c0_g1_i1.p1 TRINITY_DN27573_c0_g1~~TRINITY_DN27573_c0_g1_i1.p1  ORF type:complete len:373 (+),score=108.97 TRINITY_DN27573_c0_g1_i1:157-1275(+)
MCIRDRSTGRFHRLAMGFYTAKWIEVPDSKLGRLYQALLMVVVVGVMWKSVYNKAYLEYDSPVGFVNAKVTKWDGGDHPPEYCDGTIKCRVLDEYQVQYPDAQDRSLLLTTRIKEDVEIQQPNGKWHRNSTQNFFVQDVERFIVKVEHSFEAPHFFDSAASASDARLYGGSNRMMAGRLAMKAPGASKTLPPDGKADAFTLGELVQAAGVSLEHLADGKDDEDESIRSRGMVLMARITYKNSAKGEWGVRPPSYVYQVSKVPYTEFKVAETAERSSSSDGSSTRVLWKRFGIKVIFVQTGRIAKFSFNALVMEIVAGLALVSMAQLACDLYAYYCCPELQAVMMDSVQAYKEPADKEDKQPAEPKPKEHKKD